MDSPRTSLMAASEINVWSPQSQQGDSSSDATSSFSSVAENGIPLSVTRPEQKRSHNVMPSLCHLADALFQDARSCQSDDRWRCSVNPA